MKKRLKGSVKSTSRSSITPKRENLFVPSKRHYVRGERPRVDCILCAIRRREPAVVNLEVARDRLFFVTMNLYPYNPGHLMIVPHRHITDPREMTSAESRGLDAWTRRILDALDGLYRPHGYNIGYNIGESSGASLPHLHLHVVPRFRNEIGFIDIIGGARVHVDDPSEAMRSLARQLRRKAGR